MPPVERRRPLRPVRRTGRFFCSRKPPAVPGVQKSFSDAKKIEPPCKYRSGSMPQPYPYACRDTA
ncbi:hypothetical protein HMPREF0262_01484 [Clostridium sp. ATCC 29733]|nr:hypothetical protein HMPREF0262_01484 [Clostridium sp. ATCC 29733]